VSLSGFVLRHAMKAGAAINLEVLRSVGATQENVVKQTILVAKGQDIRAGYAAAQRVWGAHPIAITVHIVDGFGIPGALVGIEAVCALGE
jgi:2-iminobutanoate/2-iminopropanoate deaminase